MFEHRHYEKMAELIKTSEASTKNEFVLELVKLFSRDNAKFNLSRFLKASGLNQEFNKGKTISKSVFSLDISVPRLTDLRVSLKNP